MEADDSGNAQGPGQDGPEGVWMARNGGGSDESAARMLTVAAMMENAVDHSSKSTCGQIYEIPPGDFAIPTTQDPGPGSNKGPLTANNETEARGGTGNVPPPAIRERAFWVKLAFWGGRCTKR